MITVGKGLMALIWLVFLFAPLLFTPPYNWLVLGFGVIMLILHAVQLLALRANLQQSGLYRPGDGWRILLFGFFAMWELHKRAQQQQSEQQE